MKLPRLIMGRNGRWLLSYAEKNPATGTWATRTVTTHTSVRPEAEAFRRRYVANMSVLGVNAGGQDTEDRTVPLLGELIDEYLADLDQRGVRATAERLTLPKIAAGELGGLHAHQLSPEVIQDWCRRRRVANSALRRDLATLKAVLALAVRNRRIGANDKPHIAMPPAGSPRDVWLREGEEQKLWDIASSDTDARTGHLTEACAFVCLALSTGARREAICELTWDRVDLGHRLLDFRKPSRRPTKKVRAVAPINDRLLPVLMRLRDEWEKRGALNPRVVQPARHGSWWPEFQVERLLNAHGYAHVTPHVFRHTFITLNLRAGVSPWDVSQMAGVSPLVLIKHYAHHIQDARLLAQANRRFAA